MPGFSWDISARHCKTGAALRKVEGTPCSKCYALKGFFVFPGVQKALDFRLDAWKHDKDWVPLMAIRLLLLSIKHPYFRWFASGDLQSIEMLTDINKVALHTCGHVTHWLPTQERGIVKQLLVPAAYNLNIRISSTKIDQPQSLPLSSLLFTTSSITTQRDKVTCPSYEQNNQCKACRKCWDTAENHIVYLQH